MLPDREELIAFLKERLWLLAAILLLLVLGIQSWSTRAVHPPPGILAPAEPLQGPPDTTEPWNCRGYRLFALATFDIRARVLSRERYRFDRGAELAPIDLALGWGRMSDSAVLEDIHVRQSDRWYLWSTSSFPIPEEEISTHSANMHLIPATPLVRSQLLDLRVGQLAHLQGRLVRVEGPGGFQWASSLTRNDTGEGACELVWVDSVGMPR